MRDPCCPRVIHACITLVYTKFLPISFLIARSRSLNMSEETAVFKMNSDQGILTIFFIQQTQKEQESLLY